MLNVVHYHRMALLLSPNNSRWLSSGVHLGVGVVPLIVAVKFVSVKVFSPTADAVGLSAGFYCQTPVLVVMFAL